MESLYAQTAQQGDLQPTSPNPNNNTPPTEPIVEEQNVYQQNKPKSKLKKVLMVVGLFIFLGACLFGYLIFQGLKETPAVQQRVTNFLEYSSKNDFDNAYALTSSQFQATTSLTDFKKAMRAFRAQYSDFESQQQTGFSVEAHAGQPTLYNYSGIITYNNGDKGELQVNLIKEGNEYKILYIKVNVEIDRYEKFQQATPNSVLGVSTKN